MFQMMMLLVLPMDVFGSFQSASVSEYSVVLLLGRSRFVRRLVLTDLLLKSHCDPTLQSKTVFIAIGTVWAGLQLPDQMLVLSRCRG